VALHSRYGLEARAAGALPVISHGFTHFDLELTPLRLRAAAAVPAIAERADLRWINIATDKLPGLPAPVSRLLDRLLASALEEEVAPQGRVRGRRREPAALE
jgi:A/G-specific adenine glycosylase